jgi:hypothetical protein
MYVVLCKPNGSNEKIKAVSRIVDGFCFSDYPIFSLD